MGVDLAAECARWNRQGPRPCILECFAKVASDGFGRAQVPRRHPEEGAEVDCPEREDIARGCGYTTLITLVGEIVWIDGRWVRRIAVANPSGVTEVDDEGSFVVTVQYNVRGDQLVVDYWIIKSVQIGDNAQ